MKVKYHQYYKDKQMTYKFLYKMEMLIKTKLNNDYRLYTDFMVLQAQNYIWFKELFIAHDCLMNWMRKLDDANDNCIVYSQFKVNMVLLEVCNKMNAYE